MAAPDKAEEAPSAAEKAPAPLPEAPKVAKKRKWLFRLITIGFVGLLCLVILEYGLRAYKSIAYDGPMYLSAPSSNHTPHERYGWISPPGLTVGRNKPCYGGEGVATYNEVGWRAPPLAQAATADIVVCVIGDSTMQGYQMRDGLHLPHLLDAELRKTYKQPYVLPLAVGGDGTLQEVMAFEDFCVPLKPDIVIHHWSENDPINNDYTAELLSRGDNNLRKRPYWEDGMSVMRKPYGWSLGDWFDRLMLGKALHHLLRPTSPDSEEFRKGLERGWRVTDELLAAWPPTPQRDDGSG